MVIFSSTHYEQLENLSKIEIELFAVIEINHAVILNYKYKQCFLFGYDLELNVRPHDHIS